MRRAKSPEELLDLLSPDALRTLTPEIPLEAVEPNG